MNFWAELRRRHVVRVAIVYVVVAWLLVQVAVALEPALNLPSWFDTLIVALLAIGFPVALVIAWAFEITPEGLKRTAAAPAADAGRDAALARDPRTVAVLPLSNMTGDPSLDALVDGLTEDLITTLAQSMLQLQVTARNTAFRYKNQTVDVREVGEALGVRQVVEGGVQREADAYKLTLQLIDAVTGAHLWAGAAAAPTTARLHGLVSKAGQDLRRELPDELQAALAASIREAADKTVPLDPAELEAFLDSVPDEQLVMWSHIVMTSADRELADRIAAAHAITERAVARRPQDPRALSACALMLMAHAYVDKSLDIDAIRARISELCERALSIDPRDQEVAMFCTTALFTSGQARQTYAVVRGASHPPPHMRDVLHAIYENDLDGAIERIKARIAEETAPGHRDRTALTLLYFAKGDDERAVEMAEEAMPLFRDMPVPDTVRVAALELSGRSEEAKAAAARLRERRPATRFDMWIDIDPAAQRIAPDTPYYRIIGGEMRAALDRAGLLDPPDAADDANTETAP